MRRLSRKASTPGDLAMQLLERRDLGVGVSHAGVRGRGRVGAQNRTAGKRDCDNGQKRQTVEKGHVRGPECLQHPQLDRDSLSIGERLCRSASFDVGPS